MAPGDIAARLDQRFRLLTGTTRSAVNRHQSNELLEFVPRLRH
jgi:predicted ATPase